MDQRLWPYHQSFKVLHHDCISISAEYRCSRQQPASRWRRYLHQGHVRNAATGSRIHADLKWAVHESNAQKSVSKMIGVLNRLGLTLNYQTRQYVVKAFVLPKLTYCLPIWGHLECGSHTAMDITLLRMARVVLGNRAAVLDRDT